MALVSATVVGLTLAYEPFGQPYLAWIALVPWLVLIGRAPAGRAAFGWGTLTGILFFGINLWWMWTATVPGLIVLVLMLATWWGVTSWTLWGGGCVSGIRRVEGGGWPLAGRVVLSALVWVGSERIRGNLIRGFPWMYLGHSQTSWVALCQVADLAGPYGIGFWVFLVNVLGAAFVLSGGFRRSFVPAAVSVAVILACVAGYGIARLAEPATRPGPRVMVVQSNHPHLPGGAPTVSREDAAEFYLRTTDAALTKEEAVDLVVWCETAMPPLNAEARSELATTPAGAYLAGLDKRLESLATRGGAAIVTGAHSVLAWGSESDGAREAKEIRNSAYLYLPESGQSTTRYDKTSLVRFAERLPLVDEFPWLRGFLLHLAPPVAAQPMTPGDPDNPGVFTLGLRRPVPTGPDSRPEAVRLLTPICLENIDSGVVAALFRAPHGGGKRADLLVNLSGDGWFHPMERYQHLQCVILRSIENRVPMARSSNTGISGFIDSYGRMLRILPPNTSGTAVEDLALDSRVTWYTRHGDVFANVCAAVALLALGTTAVRSLARMQRRIGDA